MSTVRTCLRTLPAFALVLVQLMLAPTANALSGTITVNPTLGLPGQAGILITGNGANFQSPSPGVTSVTIGGEPAAFTILSPNLISATVPCDATLGLGNVVVQDSGPSIQAAFMVNTPPAPAVSGFVPTTGPSGTVLKIAGANFTCVSVTVGAGDTPASSLDVVSSTEIRATVAAGTTTDFTAAFQRLIDAMKDQRGRKFVWVIWAGGNSPFSKFAELELQKRYGIEMATGGNILPAMVAYKQYPGMEGALYYYFGIPKNPVNEWLVANHYKQYKSPPDFFTAGGMSAAIAVVEALKKTNGDTNTEKLIKTMEGMSFQTPKGTMTFRKEDHQAMQDMYHFKIKVDPAFAWGVPELVREIKASEMDVPILNKR